jgi:hypothetical protein
MLHEVSAAMQLLDSCRIAFALSARRQDDKARGLVPGRARSHENPSPVSMAKTIFSVGLCSSREAD